MEREIRLVRDTTHGHPRAAVWERWMVWRMTVDLNVKELWWFVSNKLNWVPMIWNGLQRKKRLFKNTCASQYLTRNIKQIWNRSLFTPTLVWLTVRGFTVVDKVTYQCQWKAIRLLGQVWACLRLCPTAESFLGTLSGIISHSDTWQISVASEDESKWEVAAYSRFQVVVHSYANSERW